MLDYKEAKRLLHPYTTRESICEIEDKQEAIKKIEEACIVACEAMDELQIYKENEKRNLYRTERLMDECIYRHENGNCLKVGGFCTSVPLSHCHRYKDWHTEYCEYKQLGTLEEVSEAIKKQNAKKPDYEGDGYAPDGSFIWDTWVCPRCETKYEVDYDDYDYCPNCGQRIDLSEDWSEEDD